MGLIPLIAAFVAGGILAYLIMSIQRSAERQHDQTDLLKLQSKKIADQDERILALEKVIEARRHKRGELYDLHLEDLQAKCLQHETRYRYLFGEFIKMAEPGALKDLLRQLENLR